MNNIQNTIHCNVINHTNIFNICINIIADNDIIIYGHICSTIDNRHIINTYIINVIFIIIIVNTLILLLLLY